MRLADKALPNKISKPRSDRNPQSNREAHAIWCAFFIPERISETLIHGTPEQVSDDSSKR